MRRLLLIAAILLLAGKALAAQTDRIPTGDGTVAGTVSGSSPTRYQAVDDHPDSAGTDYLAFGTTANSEHTFSFTAFTIPTGATGLSLDILYYDAEPSSGTNTSTARLRIQATQYSHGTTHNPSGTTYTLRTKSFATNPRTSAAWTVDDLNGVSSNALQEFGVIGPDSNPVWRVSSIMARATYTPPSNNGFQSSSPTGRHGADLDLVPPAGQARAQSFTCPGSGAQDITEIGMWVSASTATTATFRMAVFTDDAANVNPDTMVTNSESAELSHSTTTLTKVYHTYTGTKPQCTGGTVYWIAWFTGNANCNFDRATTGGVDVQFAATYPTWPTAAQWDTGAQGARDYGVYAVYQAAAGATSIKTVMGLAKASVKTVDGLAIGSVKSIDGLQ